MLKSNCLKFRFRTPESQDQRNKAAWNTHQRAVFILRCLLQPPFPLQAIRHLFCRFLETASHGQRSVVLKPRAIPKRFLFARLKRKRPSTLLSRRPPWESNSTFPRSAPSQPFTWETPQAALLEIRFISTLTKNDNL